MTQFLTSKLVDTEHYYNLLKYRLMLANAASKLYWGFLI